MTPVSGCVVVPRWRPPSLAGLPGLPGSRGQGSASHASFWGGCTFTHGQAVPAPALLSDPPSLSPGPGTHLQPVPPSPAAGATLPILLPGWGKRRPSRVRPPPCPAQGPRALLLLGAPRPPLPLPRPRPCFCPESARMPPPRRASLSRGLEARVARVGPHPRPSLRCDSSCHQFSPSLTTAQRGRLACHAKLASRWPLDHGGAGLGVALAQQGIQGPATCAVSRRPGSCPPPSDLAWEQPQVARKPQPPLAVPASSWTPGLTSKVPDLTRRDLLLLLRPHPLLGSRPSPAACSSLARPRLLPGLLVPKAAQASLCLPVPSPCPPVPTLSRACDPHPGSALRPLLPPAG